MTWIMFPGGVVSIVEKPEDRGHDMLTVRARDKRSLAAYLTMATGKKVKPSSIKLDLATDYPYRRRVTRRQAETAAVVIMRTITYPNFKDEAKRVRGAAFASMLGRVWGVVLGLEDRETRDAITKRWKSFANTGSVVQPGDDDWPAILQGDDLVAALANELTEAEQAELDELEDVVAIGGIHALTDTQYARLEELGGIG